MFKIGDYVYSIGFVGGKKVAAKIIDIDYFSEKLSYLLVSEPIEDRIRWQEKTNIIKKMTEEEIFLLKMEK